MALVNSLVSWYFKNRINQIEDAVKRPEDIQYENLVQLVQLAAKTEFGKEHRFKKIKNYSDFVKLVPLRNYEDFKPYINRMLKGEQKVLWPTDILWFAKSSGTTGDKSKFIPVSFEALDECQFKGSRDLLTIYCHNNPDSKIFDGKGLLIGGSNEINTFGGASQYGDLSAVMMNNLPIWVNLFSTPKPEVALLPNWEEKLHRMADNTINEDVRSISGVPTWTLVLIRELLKRKGSDNLLDIWPNLELFLHGGISFDPYRKQFNDVIPSDQMHYLESYNASEGFFAIQDDFNRDDLLLMVDYGIFYEFIDLQSSEQKVLPLSEVEIGRPYALVITTNAGLWRYQIGDVVTFTSKSPYRIKISGRTKLFINAFGEELMIHNAESAVKRACEQTKAEITEFTAGPVYISDTEPGYHRWLFEFKKEPTSLEKFQAVLDQSLKDENSDYEAKRNGDLAMIQPEVIVVPHGTFYKWMKLKGKLGGQNKVPRLSNNLDHIDSIQNMLNEQD